MAATSSLLPVRPAQWGVGSLPPSRLLSGLIGDLPGPTECGEVVGPGLCLALKKPVHSASSLRSQLS